MARLRGIKIILVEKEISGTDPFGKNIYTDIEVEIDNVIVAPVNTNDIVNSQNLNGKKAIYTLAIPKGDTHNWENKEVLFFGRRWRTFGTPIIGIEELIPLDWNKKVMVESYE